MTYRFVQAALAEFIEAAQYYNQQIDGLGDSFIDEIEAGIDRILGDPTMWRIVESDVRRYLTHRFPYGIYYTIETDVVIIWAVKHLHRSEGSWQGDANNTSCPSSRRLPFIFA